MIRQIILLFFRNLVNNKLFSVITLTNLIVGFATFILLSTYIRKELSWDSYNDNYERIYRLQLFMDQEENVIKHTWSVPAALSRQVLPGIPEIEKITLMHRVGGNQQKGIFLSIDKKNQVLTPDGFFADPSIFDIFSYTFIEGNPADALSEPYSIVLSHDLAKKLFGEKKALGGQVYGENKVAFTVTGVYADLPVNTDLRPDYLVPMNSFSAISGWTDYERNFWKYSYYTYVLLKKNADPSKVDAKIHDALKDYRKEHHPYLRPLSKLHLNAYFEHDYLVAIVLLYLIAILILVLSAINFINLQTANATTRLREIGIKKTVGFSRKTLWIQFISESVFIALLAGAMGIFAAQLAIPLFNRLLGFTLLTSVLNDWKLLLVILAVTLLTGFLSGLYPSFVISAFNPVRALKQKFVADDSNGISLKKVLVTAQFCISIFLLVVGFIIYRQTNFLINHDMGFDTHNLLFANLDTDKKGSFDLLRERLLQHPEIADACFSDYIPFILPGGNDLQWEGSQPDEKVFVRISNISYDFVPAFGLKMAEGRNFSREYPSDADKCLINETATRVFRWEQPIGKHIHQRDRDVEVIGVIRDYFPFSVHNAIEPHMYNLIRDTAGLDGIYTIRYRPETRTKAMDVVEEEFESYFPDDAFAFTDFQSLLVNEGAARAWSHFRNVCIFFAVISIIISSIGLFGLIMFFTKRKMKEIGIRKVLGFSTRSLYMTLSSGFLKLLLLSIVIAWPAAFYIYKILPGAHKYSLQVWEFLAATVIIFIVALATISYQIIRAARSNPVEVLKDE
jgi:putative ABC transport system permease protein